MKNFVTEILTAPYNTSHRSKTLDILILFTLLSVYMVVVSVGYLFSGNVPAVFVGGVLSLLLLNHSYQYCREYRRVKAEDE